MNVENLAPQTPIYPPSSSTGFDKARFERLIKPKSIVVIGGIGARYAISESLKLGFSGDIWAIHPTRTEMEGVRCYTSLQELPAVPDAAYVAVNADKTMSIVKQLNDLGCGGAVLHASGFSEVGVEGSLRQEQLVALAGTMPIIGPNCYGILNCLDKAVLWPDQHGCKALDADSGRGVAIITQSGNIGLNITMQKRGLPLAYMFTMGNQANVGVSDVIDILLDDPRVSAIGLHIEGLTDIHHFDRVCRRAMRKKIPIVAIKNGRSEAAAKIAMSHTSSLTGSDQLFEALFERLAIARVYTLEAFIETLKFVSIAGSLSGNKLASMSCSGGEAGSIADLIEQHDLSFPQLSKTHQIAVRETLSEYVNVENPLDYHTFIWGDQARLNATFTTMMQAGFDATLLLLDWPSFSGADPGPWNMAMQGLINASQATGHQGVLVASLAECLPQTAIDACIAANIVPMIGLDTCLCAISAAYKIGKKHQQPLPQPLLRSSLGDVILAVENSSNIDEYQAKQTLANFGLAIPAAQKVMVTVDVNERDQQLSSITKLIDCAERLGYPVVMKALSNTIVHKTELGAVQLNLQNAEQVSAAFKRMQHLGKCFLIEKMLKNSVGELIIGVTRDAQFGLTLVIGTGGVMVELLKDSANLLLPTDKKSVHQAILSLRLSGLLTGFRGQQPGDIDACVDAVMAVANFAQQHGDTLLELDINPLIVGSQGNGAYAADAYIRVLQ
ncbi:MAG: acyl-CoA synthetase (NDP forming) [Oceanospirillaceae bacterium]|jgi:acyl-CoA synthetase (NDP forming)